MKIGITCYPTYGGSGVVATELGLELAQHRHTEERVDADVDHEASGILVDGLERAADVVPSAPLPAWSMADRRSSFPG